MLLTRWLTQSGVHDIRADMIEFIDKLLNERRSMAKALSDVVARYETEKSPHLARMIEQLKAEIAQRSQEPTCSSLVPHL
jgi:hypothetical protein